MMRWAGSTEEFFKDKTIRAWWGGWGFDKYFCFFFLLKLTNSTLQYLGREQRRHTSPMLLGGGGHEHPRGALRPGLRPQESPPCPPPLGRALGCCPTICLHLAPETQQAGLLQTRLPFECLGSQNLHPCRVGFSSGLPSCLPLAAPTSEKSGGNQPAGQDLRGPHRPRP